MHRNIVQKIFKGALKLTYKMCSSPYAPEDTGKVLSRFGSSPTFIYAKQKAGWDSNALADVHFF